MEKSRKNGYVELFMVYRNLLLSNQFQSDFEGCDSTGLIVLCNNAIANIESVAIEKLARWIGVIQTNLVINGISTVEKERIRRREKLSI